MSDEEEIEFGESDDYDVDEDIDKLLMRIKITVGSGKSARTTTKDFTADTTLDYDQLEEQLISLPAIFCWWSQVLAEAKQRVALLERKIKARRGQITRELLIESKKMAADGTGIGSRGGLRQTDIKDLVESDERLIDLDGQLIYASKIASKVFGIIDALKIKSYHLGRLAKTKDDERRIEWHT